MAKKQPAHKMTTELIALFKKHNVSGAVTIQPLDDAAGGECPDGKTPHTFSHTTPSGATVTETICI